MVAAGRELMNHQVAHDREPVAAVMEFLFAPGRADGVETLVGALRVALTQLPHCETLALVVDADRITLLDENWVRDDGTCLVVGADDPGGWETSPCAWETLAQLAGDASTGVKRGRGTPPGELLAADGLVRSWFLLSLVAADNLLAVVVVATGVDVTVAEVTATEAQLAVVARSLTGVIELWAKNRSLSAELNLVRQEKQSLTRLKRLQGRFVALAAHEFKTPLTSITAYTDVLRGQLTNQEFAQTGEFLSVIRTEADRLLRMVKRVLDFTEMEYGAQLLTPAPAAMLPLVAETLQGLQPAIQNKQLVVRVAPTEGVPPAVVDRDLIRQVLVNLIGNAVKFTPPEGTIEVIVREEPASVAVSVVDNGPGIPPEDMRRIFREFYRADGTTRREEGSGLGLAIVQHIVSLHGGHVDVAAAAGGGAEFRFTVPKAMAIRGENSCAKRQMLCDELVRWVAEMTGSLAVGLVLPGSGGELAPAAVMGWSACPDTASESWTAELAFGHVLCCELVAGQPERGLVLTGRRVAEGIYRRVDAVQLSILAEVARVALQSVSDSLGHTVEAVRLLRRIRQTGVPTSTPEALDLVARLARQVALSEPDTRRLQYAAALHDAGMARVEDEIVLGTARLNVDERDEVESHVERGVDLMSPLLPDAATRAIMRSHHERYDGKGYPEGLGGDEIPRGARVLAVGDARDATGLASPLSRRARARGWSSGC